MSHVSPSKKKILDLVILLVLVGVAGIQVYVRFSRSDASRDPSTDRQEEDLLLTGLEPRPTRIPGRSMMGGENHDRLSDTVAGMKDQLSDLELMGLVPGTEPKPDPMSPPPEPLAPETPPKDPRPENPVPTISPAVPPAVPPAIPPTNPPTIPPEISTNPLPDEPETPMPRVSVDKDPEPEPVSTEGIWVRSSREGENPIRVEDHVSVDARQLAEMAGFRNISTDPQYPPPPFKITGVGSGRLGTYVIVDNQMIRLSGQINSPTSAPRAWRLVEATANEVFWEPVQ